MSHAVVQGADGAPCQAGPVKVDPDQDGMIARLAWSCQQVTGDLICRSSVLIDIDASKQVVLIVIPSAIVEPAIAASIVYVAVENFFSRNADRRWRDTFVFGLIHAFGFASARQEFGLPRGAVVPALGAFNLGVELGQVAIMSIVIPALAGLDRLLAADRDVAPARTACSGLYPVGHYRAPGLPLDPRSHRSGVIQASQATVDSARSGSVAYFVLSSRSDR